MTPTVVERALQLLDEIREIIVSERSGEKDHSPPPPRRPDGDERRHYARRETDRPLQTTIAVVEKTTSRILNGNAEDATTAPLPPGKTFKRVRVTAETDIVPVIDGHGPELRAKNSRKKKVKQKK